MRRRRDIALATVTFDPPRAGCIVWDEKGDKYRRAKGSDVTTTTRDSKQGGEPRLIACFAGDGAVEIKDLDRQQVFLLPPGLTRLGTANDTDVRLEGTDEAVGEVLHDEFDENVYIQRSRHVAAHVNGEAVSRHPLRTAERLELGRWTRMYFREEHADHGRPYGGRQGGEGAAVAAAPFGVHACSRTRP
jgi:hypothetical protein